MDKLPKWLKWTILIVFLVVSVILMFGGVTAIVGVPLAVVGMKLFYSMKLDKE